MSKSTELMEKYLPIAVLIIILFCAFAYRHFTFSDKDVQFEGYPVLNSWDIVYHATFVKYFMTGGEARFLPPEYAGGIGGALNPQPTPSMLFFMYVSDFTSLAPYPAIFFTQILLLVFMIYLSYALVRESFGENLALLTAALASIPSFEFLFQIYYGFYVESYVIPLIIFCLMMIIKYMEQPRLRFAIFFALAYGMVVIAHYVEAVLYLPLFVVVALLLAKRPIKTLFSRQLLIHLAVIFGLVLVIWLTCLPVFRLNFINRFLTNGKTHLLPSAPIAPEFFNPAPYWILVVLLVLGLFVSAQNFSRYDPMKKAVAALAMWFGVLYLISLPLNSFYIWRQIYGFSLFFMFISMGILVIINKLLRGRWQRLISVALVSLMILGLSFYFYSPDLSIFKYPSDINRVQWNLVSYLNTNTSLNYSVMAFDLPDKTLLKAAFYMIERQKYMGYNFSTLCDEIPAVTVLLDCQAHDFGPYYTGSNVWGGFKEENISCNNLKKDLASFDAVIFSKTPEDWEPGFNACEQRAVDYLAMQNYTLAYNSDLFIVLERGS